ncbi:MAG: cadherin repeat domain-containing protein, partial [Verrucomicrobiota bacterium]
WTPTMAGVYPFTVWVDDNGDPSLTNTVSFTVFVTNAAPAIANQSFSIDENSPTGTLVGVVAASDGDSNTITYAITGGNVDNAFSIDPATGTLTVNEAAAMDHEANHPFSLTVEVTDDGSPSLSRSATITVNLNDLNEAPILPDQALFLPPNAIFGTVIGPVMANDPENNPITFAIQSGNEAGIFLLNSSSGQLIVNLNTTLTQALQFVMTATDNGAPALSGTGTVYIGVEDILVSDTGSVRALVPTNGSLAATWTNRLFDDSGWLSGAFGVGFERGSGYDPLIGLDVAATLHNRHAGVYIRSPFDVPNPALVGGMVLRMKYDDGYVAYLNGTPVAQRNAPSNAPAWNATATGAHPDSQALVFEDVDISAHVNRLVAGTNVLAIHGLNQTAGNGDMLIAAQLIAPGAGFIGVTVPPTFGPSFASALDVTTANLNGEIIAEGGEDPEVFAVWDTADRGTNAGAWTHNRYHGQ